MALTDRPAPRLARLASALAAKMALVALIASTGCTSIAHRSSPLPTDGPTVIEVYEAHQTRASGNLRRVPSGAEGAELHAPTTAPAPHGPSSASTMPVRYAAEIAPMQLRFARLPNPDLVMYVFPHLASGRYPVPGYLTVFPMYEGVEYALPGEVSPLANPPSVQARAVGAPAIPAAVRSPMAPALAASAAPRKVPVSRADATTSTASSGGPN